MKKFILIAVGILIASSAYASNYSRTYNFTNGSTADGSEVKAEFDNVATASATKLDKTGGSLTGQLVFDGIATDITTDANEDLDLSPNGTGWVSIPKDTYGLKIGAGDDLNLYIDTDDVIIKNTTSNKDIAIYANDGGADTLMALFDADIPEVRFPIAVDMDAALDMSSQLISNLADPVGAQDAMTLAYFQANAVANPLTAHLNCNSKNLTNIYDLTSTNAITANYIGMVGASKNVDLNGGTLWECTIIKSYGANTLDIQLGGQLWFTGLQTSAGTNDLRYNTGTGAVTYQASSMKYKTDIVPFEDNFKNILNVEPKQFKYKTDNALDIGYIAEDFEAIDLKNLCTYKDGEVDSIKYGRLSLYIIEVLKEHEKRISKLEK